MSDKGSAPRGVSAGKPISSLSHLGWQERSRELQTRPCPPLIGVGSPQDPSPASRKFWDPGSCPRVNTEPEAAWRGPKLGLLLRLCWKFPSHLTARTSRRAEGNGPASSHTCVWMGTGVGHGEDGGQQRPARAARSLQSPHL